MSTEERSVNQPEEQPSLSEQRLIRRAKLKELQDTGQDLKILELKQSQEVHLPAWFGEAGVEPEGVDSWCRV